MNTSPVPLGQRNYLLESEVDSLIKAAKKLNQRHALRNELLILMSYRHGLRSVEAANMRWSQIDFDGTIHVHRCKGSLDSRHPIPGDELRLLRRLRRQNPFADFVFLSDRQTPIATRTIRFIIARAGEKAGIPFPVHPHMLRHGCGYYLANKGYDLRLIQSYLGHANIQNTTRYTQLAPNRFQHLWD